MTSQPIDYEKHFLVETSWEICNQLGGIYTVIRSKLPANIEAWEKNYCLLGPLVNKGLNAEFEDIAERESTLGRTLAALENMGIEVRYGTWLVSGRPKTVLLNPDHNIGKLQHIKKQLWEDHQIPIGTDDSLYDISLQWCDLVDTFFTLFSKHEKRTILFHGHEWMVCPALLNTTGAHSNVKTIFTTHATRLGRVLAVNHKNFYDMMYQVDDQELAKQFGIPSIHQLERQGANKTDCFTTVSQITGLECEALLGKLPDQITPNGLNIERFQDPHRIQIRHEKYKKQIENFVIGHFFNATPFDLNKTLFLFTSGRYEYENKGFDIIVKALKKLNEKLIQEKVDVTVVMFFITNAPVKSFNPAVLHSKALLEEVKNTCKSIEGEIAAQLLVNAASSKDDFKLPDLNQFVSDYWRLRFRRSLQSWKTDEWPMIVTHLLQDDHNDAILKGLREEQLFNSPIDKVKVVFHPEFISPTNPLFGLEYSQFVRGCHMGIFPSYYEPWGYTPLECIARGVPTITSDLSGFGSYTENINANSQETGVYVLKRKDKTEAQSVEDLAKMLLQFSKTNYNYRAIMRNTLEEFSRTFDWHKLRIHYDEAYAKAVKK
jgi:glycogen(starch) synthase